MLKGGIVLILALLGAESLNAQYVRTSQRYDMMRGRPWMERLVPGTTFQIQTQSRGALDVNMFLGYRFTGRVTAGLGWNQRSNVHFRHHFGAGGRRSIYGPRLFTDYRLPYGFSIRGEIEMMNFYAPPILGVSPPGAEGSRKWVWGVFAGIKKSFQVKDWLRTNLQLLYNLDDNVYRSNPYSDRLNVRFGVEFYMRKRIKSSGS